MDSIVKRPLFTRTFEDVKDFTPPNDAGYIYGIFEERSLHVQSLLASATGVKFVELAEITSFEVSTSLSGVPKLTLRNRDDFDALFGSLGCTTVYIDITGLAHHIWAPLIRTALDFRLTVRAVYVEPADYHYSHFPRQGEIFDLSERIDGIAPIPLFATLISPAEKEVCFVPLLGFEGTRFAYMIEQIEPPGQKIIPVIGVPGFRAEYPFHTYLGNSPKLAETGAWKNARYAKANCPFSLFYVLGDILGHFPEEHVKVAPIGTKPHALGAVLKCIHSKRPIELVYDHPKRKRQRTSGAFHCLVYEISEFMSNTE